MFNFTLIVSASMLDFLLDLAAQAAITTSKQPDGAATTFKLKPYRREHAAKQRQTQQQSDGGGIETEAPTGS
jgi:hypothetical protein